MQRTPLHFVLVLRVLTRLCVGSPPKSHTTLFLFNGFLISGIDELIANDPPRKSYTKLSAKKGNVLVVLC